MVSERYRQIARIGGGGMGEVWRVHDPLVDRTVAMKVILPGAPVERFLREARITARLQHAGVAPILDLGRLEDGRWYYTMPELRGRTLEALCRAHFQAQPESAPARRIIELFHRACETVAYAHSQGVIHRDLKPSNILVGDYGEVVVLDWGLALHQDEPLDPAERGAATGTTGFMAPEQARGIEGARGPRSDVFSLGVTLFYVLCGRLPWDRGARAPGAEASEPQVVLPEPLRAPPELVAVCLDALAVRAELRPPDAGALAEEIQRWLIGARRHEEALRLLSGAENRVALISQARAEASSLRLQAREMLAEVPPHAPEAAKHQGWEVEDRAEALEELSEREALAREMHLGAALEHAPDLEEAREALALHARARLVELEAQGRWREAMRYEAWLRADPWERHADFLRGDGAITLWTDPPGAVARLFRFASQHRRRVPVEQASLGRTPILRARLAPGSWLLVLEAPGHLPARYPVCIGRGELWEGTPPGSDEPRPVRLLPEGSLRGEELYVPAGWCRVGGDPDAPDGLTARRVWVDGFVLGRDPVSNGEYLAFLNTLLRAGDEGLAARCAPRSPDSSQRPFVLQGDRYALGMDGSGRPWREDEPVALVDEEGARAYATWRGARDGLPWRLPHDLEWEKAARGVDARRFPWGDAFDPSRAAMVASFAGAPQVVPTLAHPRDESPYGARGLAGNVRDWCMNGYVRDGDTPDGAAVQLREPEPQALRLVRGGSVYSTEALCRAAARMAAAPDARLLGLGFRLARSVPIRSG